MGGYVRALFRRGVQHLAVLIVTWYDEHGKVLFFYRQGKQYFLTYDDSRVPNHYSFHRESRLDAIEAEYKRLLANRPDLPTDPPKFAAVDKILSAMDARGAWVERGRLPHHKLEPASGIIQCQTFIDNIRTLSGWLRTKK